MVIVYLTPVVEVPILCTHNTFLSKRVPAIAFVTPQQPRKAWNRVYIANAAANTVVNKAFSSNSRHVTSKGQPPLSSGNNVSGQTTALRPSWAYLEGPAHDKDEAKALSCNT